MEREAAARVVDFLQDVGDTSPEPGERGGGMQLPAERPRSRRRSRWDQPNAEAFASLAVQAAQAKTGQQSSAWHPGCQAWPRDTGAGRTSPGCMLLTRSALQCPLVGGGAPAPQEGQPPPPPPLRTQAAAAPVASNSGPAEQRDRNVVRLDVSKRQAIRGALAGAPAVTPAFGGGGQPVLSPFSDNGSDVMIAHPPGLVQAYGEGMPPPVPADEVPPPPPLPPPEGTQQQQQQQQRGRHAQMPHQRVAHAALVQAPLAAAARAAMPMVADRGPGGATTYSFGATSASAAGWAGWQGRKAPHGVSGGGSSWKVQLKLQPVVSRASHACTRLCCWSGAICMLG